MHCPNLIQVSDNPVIRQLNGVQGVTMPNSQLEENEEKALLRCALMQMSEPESGAADPRSQLLKGATP
jgi:hypothetical protein